jgi:hypothetical protein
MNTGSQKVSYLLFVLFYKTELLSINSSHTTITLPSMLHGLGTCFQLVVTPRKYKQALECYLACSCPQAVEFCVSRFGLAPISTIEILQQVLKVIEFVGV